MYASDDTPAADVVAESPRKARTHSPRAREARRNARPMRARAAKLLQSLLYPVMRANVIVCARAGGELERCDRLSVRA